MTNNSLVRWRRVPGFEHYMISDHGDLYNTNKYRIKKTHPDHKGYLKCRLIKGATGKTTRIHRLVAQLFLDSYDPNLQVNHINCVKTDNRASNLEMVNQSQNTRHAWKNNRMKLTAKGTDGKFIKC